MQANNRQSEFSMPFRALLTDRDADGRISNRVAELDEAGLPEGEVLVAVEWSGLNYKDALCLTGLGNLVKTYPHVAGIDLAGRVLESIDARYQTGQLVALTGWRVGELHWGGYAERARVHGEWLVPLPDKLTTRDAMVLGTAGLTAMLAVNRLEGEGITPDRGNVLVTGAGGGVGSLAVYLLGRLGYQVTAVTGRPEMGDQLRRLGAAEIIDRSSLLTPSGRGLDKEQWAAAIDPVGGALLGEVLKKIRYGGAVATIGAAGGPTWEASVIPFILRGISLLGIDSVMQPREARIASWDRLANLFDAAAYEKLTHEARLEDLPELATTILKGRLAGRVIVNPAAA
jgi:acrylyl-CoA reductase (NADPH)